MTWGEIQIESLKKMFLNKENLEATKLNEYKADKKYKTYLFAMKQACNEALTQIYAICEPTIKMYELELEKGKSVYDLSEIITDYENIYDLESPNNVVWKQITKNLLKIENWGEGKIIIYYEVKRQYVDDKTEDTYKFDIEDEFVKIIPLYIAGELYKDDDLTIATVYMNEFNTMMNILLGKNSTTITNPIYTMDI